MYKKMLCIVAALALSLLGFLPGLWDSLIVRFAPKVILSTALQESFSQLQERFENDPVLLVLKTLDPEGKQTADIKLESENPYWGTVQYDMILQTEPHRMSGNGVIQGNQRMLDISVYADTEFMAVSSEELVSGQYYGITYDTFLRDIQKIPLLTWLTGDVVLQKWDSNIGRIQATMEEGYPVVNLPVLASDDLQKLFLFIIAAPSSTQEVRIPMNGTMVDAHRISYALNDPAVSEYLQTVPELENTDSINTAVDFYLYEKKLVAVDLQIETETLIKKICLEFGVNILTDPIIALITSEEDGVSSQKEIHIETYSKGPVFTEKWRFSATGKDDVSIYYEWEPQSGEMLLSINDSEIIPLTFTETENGIKIEAEDLRGIFQHIWKRSIEREEKPVSGSVVFSKGSEILTPEHRNLDQWSMEDFLILLEGLGGLIGFSF